MMTTIGFYTLGLIAAAAGIYLVSSRNLFHAVLGLAVASLAVAGLMLTLAAEFLALVLVLVYVGSVVVLAVFAVMLTGHFDKPLLPSGREVKLAAALVALALLGIITGVALIQPASPSLTTLSAGSIALLGKLLLTAYVLPFELVSVLLLAALIGAIVIARDDQDAKSSA